MLEMKTVNDPNRKSSPAISTYKYLYIYVCIGLTSTPSHLAASTLLAYLIPTNGFKLPAVK